jgi:hypothetical protein
MTSVNLIPTTYKNPNPRYTTQGYTFGAGAQVWAWDLPEVHAWLNEYTPEWDHSHAWSSPPASICGLIFKTEAQAIAFKLRWSEYCA